MDINKYRFIYSPRTTYNNKLIEEDHLYNELFKAIDPYSIKILKKHFKERLGNINKETFICILKRHLKTWNYTLPNREEMLIKLLSRLFDEIDINSNGLLDWNEFVNYTINAGSSSNPYNKNNNNNGSLYSLQKYTPNNTKINFHIIDKNEASVGTKLNYMSNTNENINYCFYIEKYKLLGVVNDGQSKINFFNMDIHNKHICAIDLIEIENKINKQKLNKLDKKSEELLKKDKNILDNRLPTPEGVRKEIKIINEGKKEENKNQINNNFQNDRSYFAVYALFINEYDILLISSTNNTISSWKYEKYKKEFRNINIVNNSENELNNLNIPLYITELPQYSMCYDNESKYLYTGQEDGKIFKWNINTNKYVHIFEISKVIDNKINKKKIKTIKKNKNSEEILEQKYHLIKENKSQIYNVQNVLKLFKNNLKSIKKDYDRETVSCLLIINKLKILCSSYYTGNIILWDMITYKPKIIYNDQQTGIYQLEYNINKNQIYSCGFNHNIYVYDPYFEKSAIYSFKGHLASVNSISLNLNTNELFSVDILGNIIIWNVDTFSPYQTININETFFLQQQKHNKKEVEILKKSKVGSNLFIKSLNNINKFIIYGEKCIIYEKGKDLNPLLCDENSILGCRYNKKTNDIITFSIKRVKFWKIFTGKVYKIFEYLMEDIGITAFEIDNKEKKFYLGDNSGRIKCFNLLNGNYIKNYKSHKSEIIHIIHSSKNNLLITASSDLYIKFHSDKDEEEKSSIIREISARSLISFSWKDKILIKNIILNEDNKTFIIGLSSDSIKFFDIEHYKFINDNNKNNEPISHLNKKSLSNIQDIEDANSIFVAYENGEKYIMVTNYNKYYLHLLEEKFGNFEDDKEDSDINKNIVLVSNYDKTTNKLLTGNQIGFIICYDLSSLINIMNYNYNSVDEAIKNIHDLYFPILFKIEAHKESITYINIPSELEPRIFFTCSTDRTLKLFDLSTGNYIDSLRQLSFKTNPLPIAIKYIKDNPFIKNKNNEKIFNDLNKDNFNEFIENIKNNTINNNNNIGFKDKNIKESDNLSIIYNELLDKKYKPYIDFDKAYKGEIIEYSDKLIEYNAKMKLDKLNVRGKNQIKNISNEWNYKINIETIIQKRNLELSLLKQKINKLDEEINDSENNFQHISIFNQKYKPLYLNHLKDFEYKKINYEISHKIKNIYLALSKNEIRKKENDDMKKFESKTKAYSILKLSPVSLKNLNQKIIFNSEEGKNKLIKKRIKNESFNNITLNRIKKKENKNDSINMSSQGLYEQKFNDYQNQFNKRYNELNEPIKNLFKKKIFKKNKLLPKLNSYITQSINSKG